MLSRYLIFIFFVFFVNILNCQSQSNTDSLLTQLSTEKNNSKKALIYFKLGRIFLVNKSDFEKALTYYNQAEKYARLAKNDTLYVENLINKYYCFARLYSVSGTDSNTVLIKKLSSYFPSNNNRLNAKYYILMGDESTDSDTQKTLNYYLEAKKYFILSGVTNLFAVDLRLVRVYQRSNQYRKSLAVLKPFVDEFKQKKLFKELSQVYHYTAAAYYNLENDSCIGYFTESANFALSTFGDTALFLSDNVLLIDYLILNKKQFNEAEAKLKRCQNLMAIYSKPLDKVTISNFYALSGNLFKNKTSLVSGDLTSTKLNINKAIYYYKLGLTNVTPSQFLINEQTNLEITYTNLSECYTKLNQADSALYYYKKANSIKDTLNKMQSNKESKELLMKYESEKKDAEINLLNTKNKAFDVKQKQNKIITLGVIIIAGLSLISLFIFINRFRIKQKANIELQEQKNIIEHANQLILKTNTELTKRTNLIQESIDYAAVIQQSILHNELVLSKNLNSYFVINQPKEAVGGDFYWVHSNAQTNKVYVAVADCTGHGVPGALMTLLCSTIFNQLIEKHPNISVNEFLNLANTKIYNSFNTDKTQQKSTNGMNVSLVCIDKLNNKLSYAGAKNSILIGNNNEIVELKVDLYSIGYLPDYSFNCYEANIATGDTLYLTTDGFADQIGGKENKKFLKTNLMLQLKALYNKPMARQKTELLTVFNNWKGTNEQKDDVCVLAIKV